MDYQQLMDWAINKFKTRKESEQWCQRTTDEETIIALQAQVNTLMSQKKPYPTGRPYGGGKKNFKQGNYKKGKGKGKPRVDNHPTWMSLPPKNGEKHYKTVKGLFEALERRIRARLRRISQNNVELLYFAID